MKCLKCNCETEKGKIRIMGVVSPAFIEWQVEEELNTDALTPTKSGSVQILSGIGIRNDWTKRFEELVFEPPSWYYGEIFRAPEFINIISKSIIRSIINSGSSSNDISEISSGGGRRKFLVTR